jgi:endonuclease-8
VPEGDSVYRLARRLDRSVRGHTVVTSQFRVPALASRDVSGRTVEEHVTHGKHLLTRFSGGVSLHSHLRMDGEWSVTRPGKRLPRHLMHEVRLVWELDDRSTVWGLRLHDLALVATDDESSLIGHLGPDPLRDDWDPAEAARRLRREPERPLVSALLDQTLIAGLGNLWVNELAFLTGVSPWTPVGEVDVDRLVARAAKVLRHSATVAGAIQVTTGINKRGEDHWVSGRQGRPCLRCGTTVEMVAELANDPDNRRTWWCPHCQPGPGPEARQVVRRDGRGSGPLP